MQSNLLFGSLDLQHLPLKIISVNLSRNKISGSISLVNLPTALEDLHLCNNSIDQKKVYYASIPSNSKVIEIWYRCDREVITFVPIAKKHRVDDSIFWEPNRCSDVYWPDNDYWENVYVYH